MVMMALVMAFVMGVFSYCECDVAHIWWSKGLHDVKEECQQVHALGTYSRSMLFSEV